MVIDPRRVGQLALLCAGVVLALGCERRVDDAAAADVKVAEPEVAVVADGAPRPDGSAPEDRPKSEAGDSGHVNDADANPGEQVPGVGDASQTAAGGARQDGDRKRANKSRRQLPENPFPRRVKAPPLSGGRGWLNTAGPLELHALRGKIVLLDFWTYCCINCMHILPDLKRLEQKYREELVVIGVHSAKFDTERDEQNIREAIVRYEIEHPVVNDADLKIWRRYGVRAWPTLVLIDPEGYAVLMVSGEGWIPLIDEAIQKLIAYHSAKGTLKRGRMHFALERERLPVTPLRFPGKVWADARRDRLFISDSNHNRIVICTLSGELVDVIGDGEIGLKDGSFETARFFRPQGVLAVGELLYVADTENHVIRVCDLKARTVRTIAGTGKQGWLRPFDPRPALKTPLSSPWDVCWLNGRLYIAMAGLHQIWVYDPSDETVRVFSGSGREGIVDGPPASAEYAQPSGLSTDGRRIFVADAETSSVRVLDPETGHVRSVVGTGLFDFGDRDGVGDVVRLQHPLHVAYWKDDLVFVADTYNNKIKLLDIGRRRCRTWLGGPAGRSDEPPRFDEPGGLVVAGGKLYVADTNNHLIRVVDLATRTVRTLQIQGLKPPAPPRRVEDWSEGAELVTLPAQRWAPTAKVSLRVQLALPDGFKLNEEAPMSYSIRTVGGSGAEALVKLPERPVRVNPPARELAIPLQLAGKEGRGTLELRLNYYPCHAGAAGACYVATVLWRIPFEIAPDGASQVELSLKHTFREP